MSRVTPFATEESSPGNHPLLDSSIGGGVGNENEESEAEHKSHNIEVTVKEKSWLEKMRQAGIKGALADRGIALKMFPDRIQRLFADGLDEDGDGFLEMEELEDMVTQHQALKKANASGQVSIASLPAKVQPALRTFDMDGDGTVDPKELQRAAEIYDGLKKRSKLFIRIIIVMAFILFMLIGCISLMTFAVVELSKETNVTPSTTDGLDVGIMKVKGSDAPVRTAQVAATERLLTSDYPNAYFDNLKQFKLSSNTSYIALDVVGWARVQDITEPSGNYVNIFTSSGAIVLRGSTMSFNADVGKVIADAGFFVTSNPRVPLPSSVEAAVTPAASPSTAASSSTNGSSTRRLLSVGEMDILARRADVASPAAASLGDGLFTVADVIGGHDDDLFARSSVPGAALHPLRHLLGVDLDAFHDHPELGTVKHRQLLSHNGYPHSSTGVTASTGMDTMWVSRVEPTTLPDPPPTVAYLTYYMHGGDDADSEGTVQIPNNGHLPNPAMPNVQFRVEMQGANMDVVSASFDEKPVPINYRMESWENLNADKKKRLFNTWKNMVEETHSCICEPRISFRKKIEIWNESLTVIEASAGASFDYNYVKRYREYILDAVAARPLIPIVEVDNKFASHLSKGFKPMQFDLDWWLRDSRVKYHDVGFREKKGFSKDSLDNVAKIKLTNDQSDYPGTSDPAASSVCDRQFYTSRWMYITNYVVRHTGKLVRFYVNLHSAKRSHAYKFPLNTGVTFHSSNDAAACKYGAHGNIVFMVWRPIGTYNDASKGVKNAKRWKLIWTHTMGHFSDELMGNTGTLSVATNIDVQAGDHLGIKAPQGVIGRLSRSDIDDSWVESKNGGPGMEHLEYGRTMVKRSAKTCDQLVADGWVTTTKGVDRFPDVCGESDNTGKGWSCNGDSAQNTGVSSWTAADTCRAQGARLCTADELERALSTGCNYDSRWVWSQTPCEWGSANNFGFIQKIRTGSAEGRDTFDSRCIRPDPDTSTGFTRCCGDRVSAQSKPPPPSQLDAKLFHVKKVWEVTDQGSGSPRYLQTTGKDGAGDTIWNPGTEVQETDMDHYRLDEAYLLLNAKVIPSEDLHLLRTKPYCVDVTPESEKICMMQPDAMTKNNQADSDSAALSNPNSPYQQFKSNKDDDLKWFQPFSPIASQMVSGIMEKRVEDETKKITALDVYNNHVTTQLIEDLADFAKCKIDAVSPHTRIWPRAQTTIAGEIIVERSAKTCSQLKADGWKSKTQKDYPNKCGESDNPGKGWICNKAWTDRVNAWTAADVCKAQGARLCRDGENIVSDGTGCGFDSQLVWTQTPCSTGDAGVPGFIQRHYWNTRNRKNTQWRCEVPSAATGFVRCCGDAVGIQRQAVSGVDDAVEMCCGNPKCKSFDLPANCPNDKSRMCMAVFHDHVSVGATENGIGSDAVDLETSDDSDGASLDGKSTQEIQEALAPPVGNAIIDPEDGFNWHHYDMARTDLIQSGKEFNKWSYLDNIVSFQGDFPATAENKLVKLKITYRHGNKKEEKEEDVIGRFNYRCNNNPCSRHGLYPSCTSCHGTGGVCLESKVGRSIYQKTIITLSAKTCDQLIADGWVNGNRGPLANNIHICGESDNTEKGWNCKGASDIWTAQDTCRAQGARLCSHYTSSKPRGTGCGYDEQWVWTQGSCEPPHTLGKSGFLQVKRTGIAANGEEIWTTRCVQPYSSTGFTRCCGDRVSAPDRTEPMAWIHASHKMGDESFDAAFQSSKNGIIRITQNDQDYLYYRRLTKLQSFRPYFYVFNNWLEVNNEFNVDFELYSTYDDAFNRRMDKRWTFCNFASSGNPVGIPRDCGPTEKTNWRWMRRITTDYQSSPTACDEVMGQVCNVDPIHKEFGNSKVYLEPPSFAFENSFDEHLGDILQTKTGRCKLRRPGDPFLNEPGQAATKFDHKCSVGAAVELRTLNPQASNAVTSFTKFKNSKSSDFASLADASNFKFLSPVEGLMTNVHCDDENACHGIAGVFRKLKKVTAAQNNRCVCQQGFFHRGGTTDEFLGCGEAQNECQIHGCGEGLREWSPDDPMTSSDWRCGICSGRGRCVNYNFDEGGSYDCFCKPGFAGLNCEKELTCALPKMDPNSDKSKENIYRVYNRYGAGDTRKVYSTFHGEEIGTSRWTTTTEQAMGFSNKMTTLDHRANVGNKVLNQDEYVQFGDDVNDLVGGCNLGYVATGPRRIYCNEGVHTVVADPLSNTFEGFDWALKQKTRGCRKVAWIKAPPNGCYGSCSNPESRLPFDLDHKSDWNCGDLDAEGGDDCDDFGSMYSPFKCRWADDPNGADLANEICFAGLRDVSKTVPKPVKQHTCSISTLIADPDDDESSAQKKIKQTMCNLYDERRYASNCAPYTGMQDNKAAAKLHETMNLIPHQLSRLSECPKNFYNDIWAVKEMFLTPERIADSINVFRNTCRRVIQLANPFKYIPYVGVVARMAIRVFTVLEKAFNIVYKVVRQVADKTTPLGEKLEEKALPTLCAQTDDLTSLDPSTCGFDISESWASCDPMEESSSTIKFRRGRKKGESDSDGIEIKYHTWENHSVIGTIDTFTKFAEYNCKKVKWDTHPKYGFKMFGGCIDWDGYCPHPPAEPDEDETPCWIPAGLFAPVNAIESALSCDLDKNLPGATGGLWQGRVSPTAMKALNEFAEAVLPGVQKFEQIIDATATQCEAITPAVSQFNPCKAGFEMPDVDVIFGPLSDFMKTLADIFDSIDVVLRAECNFFPCWGISLKKILDALRSLLWLVDFLMYPLNVIINKITDFIVSLLPPFPEIDFPEFPNIEFDFDISFWKFGIEFGEFTLPRFDVDFDLNFGFCRDNPDSFLCKDWNSFASCEFAALAEGTAGGSTMCEGNKQKDVWECVETGSDGTDPAGIAKCNGNFPTLFDSRPEIVRGLTFASLAACKSGLDAWVSDNNYQCPSPVIGTFGQGKAFSRPAPTSTDPEKVALYKFWKSHNVDDSQEDEVGESETAEEEEAKKDNAVVGTMDIGFHSTVSGVDPKVYAQLIDIYGISGKKIKVPLKNGYSEVAFVKFSLKNGRIPKYVLIKRVPGSSATIKINQLKVRMKLDDGDGAIVVNWPGARTLVDVADAYEKHVKRNVHYGTVYSKSVTLPPKLVKYDVEGVTKELLVKYEATKAK